MSSCPHCEEDHAEGMHFCPVTGRPFVDVAQRMIGRTLSGKYRIERAIGQGGMGTIFEATHIAIGTRVAVKLLHEPFAEKREPVQRLYREARATGAIGHPSIIKVFDVGETADGIPYLVMELLEGESLGAHIDRLGPRPLGFVLDVGVQLFSALHAAHRAGIIHRDLKSDNVFLPAADEGEIRIKILDFGISKFMTPEGESLRLTQTGSVLGTPYYMAPEQARGVKDLDHRIDIYSAGVILYELLLGTIPHRASNYNALLIEIITQDVGPFRHLRSDVPARLEAAVLRALARGRDQRWPDAKSLMAELNDIRERLPAAILKGDPPAVAVESGPGRGRDFETMDYDSLPVEFGAGESNLAFELDTSSGPGRGRRGRRMILLGAGGAAVLAGAVLALALVFGGEGRDQGIEADYPPAGEARIPADHLELADLQPSSSGSDPEVGPSSGPDAGPTGSVEEPGPAADEPRQKAATAPKTAKAPKTTTGDAAKDKASPAGKKPAKDSSSPTAKGKPALDRPMDNPF